VRSSLAEDGIDTGSVSEERRSESGSEHQALEERPGVGVVPEAATRDFEEEEEEEEEEILVPESNTSMIMRSYIDALIARADFATYLDDDVTVEIVGTTGPRPASRTGPHHLAAYASV
jgi:hypothetical protein